MYMFSFQTTKMKKVPNMQYYTEVAASPWVTELCQDRVELVDQAPAPQTAKFRYGNIMRNVTATYISTLFEYMFAQ